MAFKSLSAVVTDLDRDGAALQAAIQMVQLQGAHLDVLCLGIDQTQPGFYYAGSNALYIQENLVAAQEEATALERAVEDIIRARDIRGSATALAVQTAALASSVARHTRLADLVVLAKPYGNGRGHEAEAIVEAALFDGQVPVLVMPDDVPWHDPVRRVVVAWNEDAEALRAIRAALPLLQGAEVVNIAIIDPPAHGPDRSDPGGQLSQMLARHGVRAEVSVLAKTMPRVSDILRRHCTDIGADLLVMGAYGHSRFRESILGGATRHMLETSPVAVLMAH